MDAIQLEYYRRRLIHIRRIVGQNFLFNEQPSTANSRRLSNHGDSSSGDSYSRQELAQLHLELSRALARISRGKFGQCTVCRKSIQEARLRLIPYTCKCHECACQECSTDDSEKNLRPTVLIVRSHGEMLHPVSAFDRGEVAKTP